MSRKVGKALHPVLQRMHDAYGVSTLGDLAEKMGLPYGTVRNWHSRESVPSDYVWKAAADTGRNVEWIRTGRISGANEAIGPGVHPLAQKHMKLNESGSPDRFDINSYADVIEVGRPLPVREVEKTYPVAPPKRDEPPLKKGSALHSADNDVVEPLKLTAHGSGFAVEYTVIPWHDAEDAENKDVRFGSIALSASFMERRFGRREGFELLFARGNSMEPDLLDGDEVMINTNVTSFEENGIYALSIRGRVMLRRVQVLPDGSLRISSSNQTYEPTIVAAQSVDTLKIVGRMVWPRVR